MWSQRKGLRGPGRRLWPACKAVIGTAALLTAVLILSAPPINPALAAAKKKPAAMASGSARIPEVPDDDIFGFTSATGLGEAGELGFANENDGRLRKRDGSYRALDMKYELGYTISEDWWIAGSAFAGHRHVRNVTDLMDVSVTAFEGVSFEIAHRIVRRSASNPFAVTVSVEPRWGRIDGTTGLRSDFYDAAFKVFTDAVVVPDRLFWAANLSWTPQRAQDVADRSVWLTTSSTLASTALTLQVSPQLFIGVEARHLASFDRGWVDDRVGYAVYLGPTLLWKITDKIVFNATYQPQVSGKSIGNPDLRYDLDNYERAQFRAKLSVALN